ncbi:MAG: BatD family protein, partial [Oligoflexia bacterium]|nr:BatD family protein [Oligoflexia bacterium]
MKKYLNFFVFIFINIFIVSAISSSQAQAQAQIPASAAAVAVAPAPVSIKAEVNQAKIKINDELIFKISVRAKKDIAITIPEIGNEIQGLRIVEFQEEKPKNDDEGFILYQKWYKLKSDFSGSYILPSVTLNYNYNNQNNNVKTADIFVEVMGDTPASPDATPSATASSSSTQNKDIRDIKNIESIPIKWSKTVIAFLIVLFLVIIGIIATIIYNKRKKSRSFILPPIQYYFLFLPRSNRWP